MSNYYKETTKNHRPYLLRMGTVLFDTDVIKGNCWSLCDPGLEKPCIARVKAMVPIQSPYEGAGYHRSHPF